MRRFFLEVRYDGTAFHGSQIQGDVPTVQLAINKALSTLYREEMTTWGSSRTDEGVHALSNFFHFDAEELAHPELQYKLNAILPPALSVTNILETKDPELNARFAALSRQYRYRIYHKKDPFLYKRAFFYPFRLDIGLLHETAAIIKEYDDFETFSKRNSQTKTYRCTILDSHWEQHEDELHYVVEGNRFLRGMVRALTGTQLKVARGHYSIGRFREIIESKDCRLADFSVDGFGLYLEKVVYPSGVFY